MDATPSQPLHLARRHGFAHTGRVDAWWLQPAATALGLAVFFGYLTFRAFNATHVWYEPYISPTVAPPLFTPASGYPGSVPVDHAWLGAFPGWWPSFLPQSPAFFFPALAIAFRFTCYYYRGAGYKALAFSPPSCSVRGASRRYRGETALLLFQNLHRYTLYGALFLLVCLWWEAGAAFFRGGRFGVGVGTAIMRDQREPALGLRVRLPLVAAPDRRAARLFLVRRREPRRSTGCGKDRRGSTNGTCCSPGAASSGWPSPISISTCSPPAA